MDKLESLIDQDVHLMEDEQKIEMAKKHRELGKECFAVNNLEFSYLHFTYAIKYLLLIDPNDATEASLAVKKEMLHVLYNNAAGCHILKGNWQFVTYLCDAVLLAEPTNVKALYRRGTAFIEIQEYEKAQEDLLAAQSLEPNNLAVQKKISILNARVKAYNEKTKKSMMKLFQA